MKQLTNLSLLALAGMLLVVASCLPGCKTSTSTTPQTLAPGYNNPADQTMGVTLAAIVGFVNQEKVNYAALPPAQQAAEKPFLNDLITATDLANATYTAYHSGTATQAAAQSAISKAQASQSTLVSKKEAH